MKLTEWARREACIQRRHTGGSVIGARGRGFNRAVTDASLAEIRRQLECKSVWHGSQLVVADRWFPSTKLCSRCDTRKPNVPLDERVLVCPDCGIQADRETDGAQAPGAAGDEASTPHRPPLDQTEPTPSHGEAA